uniref:AD domain-containing protein n=1 Tax=Salix viminalis TaxID=40686 RepID=A0A6N2MIW5_SALVM
MEGSNINSEDFTVGCLLSIKTTLGEEFDGQFFFFFSIVLKHQYCYVSSLRFLNYFISQEGSKPGPKRNIRFLKANYIKELSFLGQAEDPLDIKKCYIDLHRLQAREELAVRQAEADAERIGVGVTAEAQSIFDALSKTLPVRWDKTSIVVMNEVHVSSPYLPECVSGGTPAANDRVKKVLELERKRLQARGAGL